MAVLTYSQRATRVSAILRLLEQDDEFDERPDNEDKRLILEEALEFGVDVPFTA